MAKISLKAEVTGVVFRIEVAVGDRVRDGETVMLLESMKMEIPVTATADGTVADIFFAVGDPVEENVPVAVIET